jgi:gliding motility-associated lipoprotein GldD
MIRNGIAILALVFVVWSCGSDSIPKPKPYLTLNYPEPMYVSVGTNCPYTFEISDQARFELKDKCWGSIEYPELRATIHLTYRQVSGNLDEILAEVEKLTFEHTIKADAIDARPYENLEQRIFGKMYYVEGNVATNIQFRATDSTHHVLSGALYFYTRPNYDSILPAIRYIEKDMKHLMETLEWKTKIPLR